MRDTSFRVSPVPGHAFFKQPVLQSEIVDQLLQAVHLRAQILDLARRGLALGVPGQPLLAGLQELLRPRVIKAISAISSRRHSSAIECSPRRPDNTIRTFSSAEYRFRVARRIARTCSTAVSDGPGFCLICAPSRATMSQSLRYKAAPPVSKILTADTWLSFDEFKSDVEKMCD